MAATPPETLERLEREAALARASLSSTLAQVRHRLEADRLKEDAERLKQHAIDRVRERGLQMLQERRVQLKERVVAAAMDNPAPTLALGTLIG